jgi:hypothetical protein
MPTELTAPTLSPRHLAELLAGDWFETGPLRINQRLTLNDLGSSLVVVNARRMLQTVREWGGAPVTREGRFAAECVARLIGRLWFGQDGEFGPSPSPPRTSGGRVSSTARTDEKRALSAW